MRRMESQVDGTKQRVALMGRMIADFGGMAAELDRQILIEQERAGVHDPAHFAYPIYAKAAALRRDNLKHSADELQSTTCQSQGGSSRARRGCVTRARLRQRAAVLPVQPDLARA